MKNTFHIFLLTVATFITLSECFAQISEPIPVSKESEIDMETYSGIISEQYTNGSPSLWKTVVNGKTEGLWLEWYPNGTLRYRANWKNSLGNGKWEYFYPNGQLRSESFYIDDIAQGIFREYHENGQLKTDLVFLNGRKDGVEFIYDVNGVLVSRKRYKNGVHLIDEPIIFQKGIVSVPNGNEYGITFMPDGNTAYFTRRNIATGEKRIYTTLKKENGWSEPTIAVFSKNEDETAFVNNDGSKLYFASYKPLPNGKTTQDMDMNIWVMDRINDGWSEPIPLPEIINKSVQKIDTWPTNYEAGPSVDASGNLFFWTKGTKSEGTNLYFSKLKKNGEFSEPIELLPPSSHLNYDTAPQLSPDGTVMVFSSDNRHDGFGGSDIYYSIRLENGWSEPKNLGPVVNSSYDDGFPSFSPDGKYLYFSSNRGNLKGLDGERVSNLYYMETQFLMIKK